MHKKHRVLMVDDNQLLLRAFSRLFQCGDYEFLTVTSGKGAIEILQANKISVIVTDEILTMEEGKQVLEMLFKDHPHTQRIVFTGWPNDSYYWEKIKTCKPFAVVSKPDADNQLPKVIDAAIREYEKQSNISFDNPKSLIIKAT